MAATTFQAQRTIPVGGIEGPLSTVINLVITDTTTGVHEFRQADPDDAYASYVTSDPATITLINGMITGLAAEGITVTAH